MIRWVCCCYDWRGSIVQQTPRFLIPDSCLPRNDSSIYDEDLIILDLETFCHPWPLALVIRSEFIQCRIEDNHQLPYRPRRSFQHQSQLPVALHRRESKNRQTTQSGGYRRRTFLFLTAIVVLQAHHTGGTSRLTVAQLVVATASSVALALKQWAAFL